MQFHRQKLLSGQPRDNGRDCLAPQVNGELKFQL